MVQVDDWYKGSWLYGSHQVTLGNTFLNLPPACGGGGNPTLVVETHGTVEEVSEASELDETWPTDEVQPTRLTVIHPDATVMSSPTAVLTPTSPLTEPAVAYVMSNGTGDYLNLETAIRSVATESTIVLDEGIFRLTEPLNIDKSLTLRGAGSDKTLIRGEGPVAVIRYSGQGLLTIQGITIEREGDFAATPMAVLSGEVDFRNCRFTNGATNEEKSILGVGLVFMNDSMGIVENCEIDGNAQQGIVVTDLAKPELINNDIHDNGGPGIYFQIDENGGLVEMNALEGNGLAGLTGNGNDITVSGPFTPVLKANTCSHEGVRFGGSELGDHSGIVFVSRTDLPEASAIDNNNCVVAWCTAPGSFLNMVCQAQR